ncbi:hypothetical protein SHKM778_77840 [Streptomyces sp. KM77-8]|uniref:Uncharacterized protein n=1 Tax=Streptomyces haneummycinicus TaxID=3074435 RepID=A0AAT9HVI1_9ACTN
MPALGIPLTVDSQPEESTGNARVDAGQRALGAWIYLKYIAPAWR